MLKTLNRNIVLLGLLTMFLISMIVSSYSQSYSRSLCVYWKSSEIVFVGRLKQDDKEGKKNTDEVTFSVRRSIKGAENMPLLLATNQLYQKKLTQDQDYLVFLRYDQALKRYVLAAPFLTIFIDNLPSTNGVPTIAFGEIPAANLKDLEPFKITVFSAAKTYEPKFDEGGTFSIVLGPGSTADVTVEAPKGLETWTVGNPVGKITYEDKRTLINYTLGTESCPCTYQEFHFSPR